MEHEVASKRKIRCFICPGRMFGLCHLSLVAGRFWLSQHARPACTAWWEQQFGANLRGFGTLNAVVAFCYILGPMAWSPALAPRARKFIATGCVHRLFSPSWGRKLPIKETTRNWNFPCEGRCTNSRALEAAAQVASELGGRCFTHCSRRPRWRPAPAMV